MNDYAISINWYDEFNKEDCFDKWINHGRHALENACTHNEDGDGSNKLIEYNYCDECGVSSDGTAPMMNYGYLLESKPSEEQILAVVSETNLTVMENTETDEFFLVLTGGGMDLSQDIALAYLLCGEQIPVEVAIRVSTQYGLSKSGENWFKLMNACVESLESYAKNCTYAAHQAKEAITDAKKKLELDKKDFAKKSKEAKK